MKNALIFGLSLSALHLLWLFLELGLGWHTKNIADYGVYTHLSILPWTILWVWGVYQNKKMGKKEATFARQFQFGLVATAVSTAVIGPMLWLYFTHIHPSFFSNMITYAMEQGHFSSVQAAEAFYNLSSTVVFTLTGNVSMGVLYSASLAWLFSSNE